MERSMIIKALGCCIGDNADCNSCPYWVDVDVNCFDNMKSDALALIKELTEECENYKSIAEYQQNCNMDRGFKIKRLTEENERLKNICDSYALQYGTSRDKEVFLRKEREDTVKRFAERLKAICWGEIISPSTIDRIAKEILEEEKK